jgi:autotransporter translocation and assembly factor TamB
MKKLGIIFIILFTLVVLGYALLQSALGKNYLRAQIAKGLEESGVKVEIERIDGALPHRIQLKRITITGSGIDATIQELHLPTFKLKESRGKEGLLLILTANFA